VQKQKQDRREGDRWPIAGGQAIKVSKLMPSVPSKCWALIVLRAPAVEMSAHAHAERSALTVKCFLWQDVTGKAEECLTRSRHHSSALALSGIVRVILHTRTHTHTHTHTHAPRIREDSS